TDAEEARVRERYGVAPSKLLRVANPLDLEVWRPADGRVARAELGLAPDAAVAVWHGRVEIEKKGLDVLLTAWRLVGRSDARLLLIGSGRDDDRMRRRIDSDGLQGIV